MKYLQEVSGEGKLYSFGKVSAILSKKVVEVTFRGFRQEVKTNCLLAPGDWVKFYGKLEGGMIVPIFVLKLEGFDIDIMEKGIEYIRANAT